MIYTTYFAQLRKLPNNFIPISICGKAPSWYVGKQYKKLAPKYDFFIKWKQTHDNDYYIEHFNKEVLSQLAFTKVISELQCMLPDEIKCKMETSFYNNKDYHIALVCYEKPGDFCHRHLVSKWFEENGIKCEEWSA